MLIATGLGIGLTLLVDTGLMSLAFISNPSGHDEQRAISTRRIENDD